MFKRKGIGFLFVFILGVLFACKHHPEEIVLDNGDNGGTVNPPDTIDIINPDPCDPDSVYFQNSIAPILNSMCSTEGCHDGSDPDNDVLLTSYLSVMEEVNAGDPGNSDLYEVITEKDPDNQMPPADSPQLTNDQIALIQTWISQGAQNNSCQEDCNPDDFSYANNILPVVSAYCVGCHGGSSPDADLTLESYTDIQTIALDGRLMDALLGQNGVAIMPDNTTGLPDCNISNFQNWVNAGAPNN